MALITYIFEDHTYSNFYPLTYNRPVCELLFGMTRLRDKIAQVFPRAEIRLLCRDFLSELVREKTGHKVNDFSASDRDKILLLNGRVVADSSTADKFDLDSGKSYWSGEDLVAVTLTPETLKKTSEAIAKLPDQNQADFFKKHFSPQELKVKLASYLWDLVSGNPEQITADFAFLGPILKSKKVSSKKGVDQKCVIYNSKDVYIGKNARIEAFAVLNAQKGPIYIDDDCRIQAFTRIEGPAYIGRGTEIYGAKISGGCSFGPVCRLGGEIQNSIFLGYDNKHHQGFMGHSYLGEWVNLGAGTFNSDLKNNYSKIKVTFGDKSRDKSIDTGLNKVGCFIGDHSKTGIGTLLNTGSYLGLGANLFGGGMNRSKFTPSFSWGGADILEEYRWDEFIAAAEVIMHRRGVQLSPKEMEALKKIFQLTKIEREALSG